MNRPIGHIQNQIIMHHHNDRRNIASSLLIVLFIHIEFGSKNKTYTN